MTRDAAYQAMLEGKKISHTYFSSNEFYRMEGRRILAEDGVNHTTVFWSTEQNDWRKDGWFIVD